MTLDKSKIFFILTLSFIGGVFVRSVWGLDILFIWAIIVLLIAVSIVDYKNKKVLVVFFAGTFFLLGIGRTEFSLREINNLSDKSRGLKTTAIIIKEPEAKNNHQQIIVKTNDITGKILVKTSLYKKLEYGDEINLQCQIVRPENFNEDFDYKMYLAKNRIYYICQKANIEKTGKNYGNEVYISIIKFKNKAESNINKLIPQPQAGLANGLLFGGDNRLSSKMKTAFSRTGMTHIVAVSGYNVTIIAEYLIWLGILLGLWRPQAFWFALIGIFLFVLMIGFPASAVRAGVMGSILLWAMKNGRLANSQNAIILAGAIMLVINPLLLRYDIGFQLSFLATLGIVELSPLWEQYFTRKLKVMGLVEIFFMTISAQIFVLPIIIYNFHTFSWLSIPANMMILLIIPFTMLLVFLTIITSFVFPLLSVAFGWLAYLPLAYEISIVNFFAGISWASQEIEEFNFLFSFAWYIGLFIILFFTKRKLKQQKMKNLL